MVRNTVDPPPEPYRALREAQAQLRQLTDVVSTHLAALDQTMQEPSAEARGKRMAALVNALDLANDAALHFGLALSFRAIARRKQRLCRPHTEEEGG